MTHTSTFLDPRTLARLQGLELRTADCRGACLGVRHRIKTNFNADAEGITPDEIVKHLIAMVPKGAEKDAGDVYKTA